MGSFVPPNLISEEQRQENLQKWSAYQDELLIKDQEMRIERAKKEEEFAQKC